MHPKLLSVPLMAAVLLTAQPTHPLLAADSSPSAAVPAAARWRNVYESRMGPGTASEAVKEDEADEDEEEDAGLGFNFDATYNSAAQRGGAWGFGGQYSHELGDDWGITVFGLIFPHAEDRYDVLDCGCDGGPKEYTYSEDDIIWQAGLRLERRLWRTESLQTVLFLEAAGPGLVSQRGMDFQLGLHGAFDFTEKLCLYGTAGGSYSTATLDDTRHTYAFGRLELDYTTGWLPNGSDHWFIGTYVESGDIKDEGAYVQFSAGVAFEPWSGTEIEARVGTEAASPYDEREDVFVQVGLSWSF